MNTRRVGALALTLVLAAIPASAQDARVEAARKEGKVVWYTSLALSSSERVAKLFEAAYPELESADRKSTRLNSSHSQISYAVFCLKKKKKHNKIQKHYLTKVDMQVTSRPKCC